MASKKTSESPDRMATIEDMAVVPPKLTFGMGWKPDAPDERDFKARALFGARAALRAEAMDLEACVRVIRNQDVTSSCVGQGIGGAINTRLCKLRGPTAPFVSEQAIYTYARALARLSPDEKLTDTGSSPRFAMKGLKADGVPTLVKWPFDESKINDDLPWDVMQESSAFTLSAWWRIDSFGTTRILDICQALQEDYPVVFALDVDSDFQQTGVTKFGAQDPTKIVGGHMMYCVGFKTDPTTGKKLLRCVNSWGESWGDHGFFWAEEEFFLNASDVYVIQVS